jgi:hypothetical protein
LDLKNIWRNGELFDESTIEASICPPPPVDGLVFVRKILVTKGNILKLAIPRGVIASGLLRREADRLKPSSTASWHQTMRRK